MDDRGLLEDVQIFIDDNEVFLRQWNETLQTYDLIIMSHDMFDEFNMSLDETEGMFKVEKNG